MPRKISFDRLLAKVRAVCLSLPDTKETPTWGSPHFRVGEKIFAGCGEGDGQATLGCKLEMGHAAALVATDPRFTKAPYVGHKGWVSLDLRTVTDWDEVGALVLESYRLIAPKRTVVKLDADLAATAPPRKRPVRKP